MHAAKFSNGHTVFYTGKRQVSAAWMITRTRDGYIMLTGFSRDNRLAEKNARAQFPLALEKGQIQIEVVCE